MAAVVCHDSPDLIEIVLLRTPPRIRQGGCRLLGKLNIIRTTDQNPRHFVPILGQNAENVPLMLSIEFSACTRLSKINAK